MDIEAIRHLFNNIFIQTQGSPGTYLPPREYDFKIAGNINWSVDPEVLVTTDFLLSLWPGYKETFRNEFEQKQYPPDWKEPQGQFADPRLGAAKADWKTLLNPSLVEKSPAVDAGADIPTDWLDPLRDQDAGKPDVGAIPFRSKPWGVGVQGRIPISPEGSP